MTAENESAPEVDADAVAREIRQRGAFSRRTEAESAPLTDAAKIALRAKRDY